MIYNNEQKSKVVEEFLKGNVLKSELHAKILFFNLPKLSKVLPRGGI